MKRILVFTATAIGLVASATPAGAQVVVLGPGIYPSQTMVCEVRREPISDERGWRVRDVIICSTR